MATYAEAEFDPDFPLSDEARNVLIGMVVGAIEAPGDCLTWSVQDLWIEEYIPSKFVVIRGLLDHGYLWAQGWADGTNTLGLTEGGLEWVRENYGMPPCADVFEIDAWIDEVLEPQFVRREGSRKPIGRATREMVSEMTYSPAQAQETHAMLDRLAARGNMSPESVTSLRSLVERNTARTVH